MKLITVEEHYSSKIITDEICKLFPNQEDKNPLHSKNETDKSIELGAERIAYMDKRGIDSQVISYAGGFTSKIDLKSAIYFCEKINNSMYESGNQYKGRFYYFAHLPLASAVDAAKELERCVKELGFVGAMISGHYEDIPYDDEHYMPIFEKAEELDVPIYLHPGIVNGDVAKVYYQGKWDNMTAFSLAGYGIGWHYEVGIQIVRMMLSGVFDRFPNLKIILGHWGELVSFYMYRLDEMLDYGVKMKNKFSYYFKNNIYVNPSGMLYKEQFEYCQKTFGIDHILWGEDYPYRKIGNIKSFIETLDISEEAKNKIAYENARTLLRI